VRGVLRCAVCIVGKGMEKGKEIENGGGGNWERNCEGLCSAGLGPGVFKLLLSRTGFFNYRPRKSLPVDQNARSNITLPSHEYIKKYKEQNMYVLLQCRIWSSIMATVQNLVTTVCMY
jgi:hypothetical protein